ncbi:hypothetical protein LRR81_15725 [Metabacillus sp. GX 13764]|uniref:hypothetical protein n=1 Tax=Metabacillus kandeliae TaxID=2900151 RepID=UPI001E284C25|nr:hypothetical protein [Metabacillus kandeliae]MCD7035694.1 hypothetical protein [Metabacillus kandeliae]
MFAVHFFEERNTLLTQLLKSIPAAGDDVKVKGRKGKVLEVTPVDEKNFQVFVKFESAPKGKSAVEEAKKKKGKK